MALVKFHVNDEITETLAFQKKPPGKLTPPNVMMTETQHKQADEMAKMDEKVFAEAIKRRARAGKVSEAGCTQLAAACMEAADVAREVRTSSAA